MHSAVLDLDTPSSYADKLQQIVYAENTWSVLSTDFNGPCNMYQELHNRPEDVNDPFIKNLRDQCEEALRKDYTHVAAYHACRSGDPDEYRQHGILTSSRERLHAKAREVFMGMQGLDEALAASEVYFQMYDESVSLYTTARFAPTDYLYGSHYLSMVAANLGSEAQSRLASENKKGRPVFVQCAIPVPWLEDKAFVKEPYLYLYSTPLIKKLIWTRTEGLEQYRETIGVLVVFSPIPPENVESILDADAVCIQWQEKSQLRSLRPITCRRQEEDKT